MAVRSAISAGGGGSSACSYVLHGLYGGLFAHRAILYTLCLFRPLGGLKRRLIDVFCFFLPPLGPPGRRG